MREPNGMPEDAKWPLNVEHIIRRLKLVTAAKTDVQLALVLGVAQNTIAGWRRRKTVPWELLVRVHHDWGVDLNWLLLGQAAIDSIYQWPVLINRAGPGWGSYNNSDENMWRWGLNAIFDAQPPDFHVVASREHFAVPRREILIAVPVGDDAMSPTVPEGAVCTCELLPRLIAEDPGYDFSDHHNRLCCLAAGHTTRLGGELVIRRIRKNPGGEVLVIADNPSWQSFPLVKRGARLVTLVGEVRAVLTVIPRPED